MPTLPDSRTLLLAFAAINLFTYFLFWHDKRSASRGNWRVSEAMLLLCSLLGGSPAAYCAMKRLRHKTRKASFRLRYWGVVVLQVIALVLWNCRHMLKAYA